MIFKNVNNKVYSITVKNGINYLRCFDNKFRNKQEIENLASYYILKAFGIGICAGLLASIFIMVRC